MVDKFTTRKGADVPPTPILALDLGTATGWAVRDATVIAAMRSRGYAPADDNQADALALLGWALDQPGMQA